MIIIALIGLIQYPLNIHVYLEGIGWSPNSSILHALQDIEKFWIHEDFSQSKEIAEYLAFFSEQSYHLVNARKRNEIIIVFLN